MKFHPYFSDISKLDELDWDMIENNYWSDTIDDNDRKRRKQAEFMVYKELPWSLVKGIGVFNSTALQKVVDLYNRYDEAYTRPCRICEAWYYTGR